MTFPISEQLGRLLDAVVVAGGHPYIVGGCVRDWLLGRKPKDIDVECYHVSVESLEKAFTDAGFKVDAVGRAFGVLKITDKPRHMGKPTGMEVAVEGETFDVSLPRRDNKTEPGHRGFVTTTDPDMTIEEAGSRRDFTINTLALDPINLHNGEPTLVDCHGAIADLEARVLRHVSPAFDEDPLRVLRGVQFAARFGFTMAPETIERCKTLKDELKTLPKERLWEEWKKLLVKGTKPSLGLDLLVETGAIDLFPEVKALLHVPQEYAWHPEGWRHETWFHKTADESSLPWAVEALVDPRSRETSLLGLTKSFEAGAAEPTGLVWAVGSVAACADKGRWIVTKVPLAGVRSIVGSSINDFEVVQGVVTPVAVYMMHVLRPQEASTQFQFHEDAMKTDSPIASGPTGVEVSAVVVDARGASVDGYVKTAIFLVERGIGHTTYATTEVTLGDVWFHNNMVTDAAVRVLDDDGVDRDDEERLIVMLSAFCHDLGKPETTVFERGRIRAHAHEEAGEAPTRSFLTRIGAPPAIIEAVIPVVMNHLKPFHFGRDKAAPSAIRRLAVKVPLVRLCRCARADFLGRTTAEALATTDSREIPETKWLLEKASTLKVKDAAPTGYLMGRHLLALGMKPGKAMGDFLKAAFEDQMEGVIVDEESAIAWAKAKMAVSA